MSNIVCSCTVIRIETDGAISMFAVVHSFRIVAVRELALDMSHFRGFKF